MLTVKTGRVERQTGGHLVRKDWMGLSERCPWETELGPQRGSLEHWRMQKLEKKYGPRRVVVWERLPVEQRQDEQGVAPAEPERMEL